VTIDVALVGGGLANSLIAWRLAETAPDLELLVLEQEGTLGGDHVWSYHGSDLTDDQRRWIEPLVEKSWSGQEVRFPGHRRVLDGRYHSVTSRRLDSEVRARLGKHVLARTRVAEVAPDGIVTARGDRIAARVVIDGRGLEPTSTLAVAWQKFVGLHVEIEKPAGVERPILMDATVEQIDGYRFVYTLPFSERRLLIEDTYYSDGPDLDWEAVRERITGYAADRGWRIREVVDEEAGVLPIVLAGDIDAFWRERPTGIPCSGMRAALFHPTTGYSLPDAVRLADEIADAWRSNGSLDSAELDRMIRALSRRLWRRGGFFRLLNRMLFLAAEPRLRYRVLERFYRLPEPLIERFYAGRPGWADRARILTGKPPVPLGRALPCLLPRSARGWNPKTPEERRTTK
jgi:lycopene beta-cyclase